MKRNILLATLFISAALVAGGCGAQMQEAETIEQTAVNATVVTDDNYLSNSVSAGTSTLLDTSNMFTDRDLEQEADLTDAQYITLESGKDVTISSEGVYVITGSVKDTTIIVDANEAKVQLVLDKVTITNTDFPAIYVKSADKVFITTTDSENSLSVTGSFSADGETNTDAVVFAKDDIVFNGKGSLLISSTANGISGKDDIRFTGGTYNITSTKDAIEANDSIRICDGTFTIKSGKDALHSENSDDASVGFVYISGGTFDVEADGDGIQATTALVIDGGTFNFNTAEGLEGTYVQINDGEISISANDDGINAAAKGIGYDTVIEINGGKLTINMGSGDTDAVDANGNIYINGGTIDITAQFAFDFDGTAQLNGGTVTVNGEEVTELTNSMMMGGGHGGFGGAGGPGGNMQGFEGMEGNRQEFKGHGGKMQGFGAETGEMPELEQGSVDTSKEGR